MAKPQKAGIATSKGSLAVSHANQSDLVVLSLISRHPSIASPSTYGNNPIPLTFHTPNANASNCIAT